VAERKTPWEKPRRPTLITGSDDAETARLVAKHADVLRPSPAQAVKARDAYIRDTARGLIQIAGGVQRAKAAVQRAGEEMPKRKSGKPAKASDDFWLLGVFRMQQRDGCGSWEACKRVAALGRPGKQREAMKYRLYRKLKEPRSYRKLKELREAFDEGCG
jgi:hypothetical protein